MKPATMFILPDQHYAPPGDKAGGADVAAEFVAIQAIRIVKPDIFVNLGDVIEANSISHWKFKKVRRPPLEYQLAALDPEIACGNVGLDRFDHELDKVGCNRRILTAGNHCGTWMEDFVEAHPYLVDKYHPKAAFKMKERGYEWYPYGKFVKVGDLNLYHGGLLASINVERDHAMKLGANIAMGHYHHIGMATVAHMDGPHGCWSLGCIAQLEKQFLKNRKTNWQHGFGIAHFDSDGKFNMEVIHIFDGVAWVYGKKLEAK